MTKHYDYVGPADIKARCAGQVAGTRISSLSDLLTWIRGSGQRSGLGSLIPATFVIDEAGGLLLADRCSEHVACAGGGPVLSAGELFLRVSGDDVEVAEVSNQSTGFCPEPESWPAVAAALDRIGVPHPGRITTEVVFRRCEKCAERNVVKEGWFVCGICGADLPAEWNF
jgi:hypothetical protein